EQDDALQLTSVHAAYADDVFKVVVRIEKGAFGIGDLGVFFGVDDAVKGKGADFLQVVVQAEKGPAVVVLPEVVGVDHHLYGLGVPVGLIGDIQHAFVQDIMKQASQAVQAGQVLVGVKTDDRLFAFFQQERLGQLGHELIYPF